MTYSPAAAFTPGVSAKVLALAFHEIATMLTAGMPLNQALDAASHHGPPHFQRALRNLAHSTAQGTPVSETMRGYGGLFHPIIPAIIGSGEQSGNLDHSFALLAEFFEAEDQLRRTVQSALIYPTIVVVFAIIVVGVLSWIGFMSGAWATRLMIVLAVAAGIWLLMRFRLVQRGARYISMFLPFFGVIMQQLSIARFCTAFGLQVRAGVPFLEGLQTTRPVIQHPIVERAVDFLYAGVRNGNTVEDSIRAQPVFPPIVQNLVGSGEAAGSLDDALLKSAEYLRRDAEFKIKAASKFAGPVMVIVVGIIVALILISFWSSYFGQIMSVLEQ